MAPNLKLNRAISVSLLFLAFSLVPRGSANATIWHVERDGSGDFTVIQDAVDAAESGDTIMLGPGRFTETSDFQYFNNRTIQACVALNKSLTILGSGKEATYIGPEVPGEDFNEYGTSGISSISSNLELVVRDLTFIDCDGNSVLFSMENGGCLAMERVGFENSYKGASLTKTISSSIVDCTFQDIARGVTLYNVFGMDISGCQFRRTGEGIAVHFSGSQNINIQDCHLSGNGYGSIAGIILSQCGSVWVDNCVIHDNGNYGIYISDTYGVTVINTTVGGVARDGIDLGLTEDTVIQNNVFHGRFAAMSILYPSEGQTIESNHILRWPGSWSVWVDDGYDGPVTELDFSNNYWGTTNPELMDEGIWDLNDDPEIQMIVNYLPMADGPVSTKSMTLDQVKALYR